MRTKERLDGTRGTAGFHGEGIGIETAVRLIRTLFADQRLFEIFSTSHWKLSFPLTFSRSTAYLRTGHA